MPLVDVELTGELLDLVPEKTSAQIRIKAKGGTFPDQIEALQGSMGQRAALTFASTNGLAGAPTVRRTMTSPYPLDKEGKSLEAQTGIRASDISGYCIEYEITTSTF
jgi:hypothetical protein